MKKSLLALAVLGAMASVAQAQTSVTLYGIVDGGLLYKSNQNAAGDATWSFGSGIEATNRWGIRGSEDLGGGLSATFALENGFASGTGGFLGSGGTTALSGKLFDRGATVGLKGNFGTLTMGRNWTPFVLSQIAIDSNGFSNFGSLNSLAFQAIPGGATQAGLGTGFTYYWVDNSFSYTTPNFNGFSASALVGLGGVAGDNGAGRTLSVSGTYANGPLAVAIGYYDSKLNGTTGNNTLVPNTESGQRAWHLGGKYNFGPVTASLEYAQYKIPYLNALDVRFWDLGASIPVGPNGVVYLNYLNKRDQNTSSNNGQLYKIAYDHNFSKTTTAYVNLGFTRNDSTGTMGPQNAGYVAAGKNGTALGVGMRKAF
jgi:general bacterial porin, GBP family